MNVRNRHACSVLLLFYHALFVYIMRILTIELRKKANMAKYASKVGRVIGIILIAAIVGGALGHLFANVLPEGPVKDFFGINFPIGFNNFTLNLYFLEFTLGFRLHINFMSLIGVLVGYYILRFTRN